MPRQPLAVPARPRSPRLGPQKGAARCLRAGPLATCLLAAACADPSGIVEVDWAFVDRQGDAIFPGGRVLETPDTCRLAGRDSQGSRDYRLQTRLVVREAECEAGDTDGTGDGGGSTGSAGSGSCEVASAFFGCDRARGALTEVPPSDAAYVMELEVWATPAGDEGPAFRVRSECIAAPGPRARKVEAGRITDLSVYQLVAYGIDLADPISGGLDLVGCRGEAEL